jgi:hypothetical protein
MSRTAIGFGIALIVVGLGSYVAGGASSVTALIPAIFGLALVGLGWWGTRGSEKTAMHIATVVGLVGTLAPVSRVIPSLTGGGELGLAFWSNAVMLVISGAFFALCVKSFVDARRARAQAAK